MGRKKPTEPPPPDVNPGIRKRGKPFNIRDVPPPYISPVKPAPSFFQPRQVDPARHAAWLKRWRKMMGIPDPGDLMAGQDYMAKRQTEFQAWRNKYNPYG